MSVRKRAWTTSKGVEKEAWVVDYVDQACKRHLKTFSTKKAATDFQATANVEIRTGVHTADSASVTVAKAGKLWIETAKNGAPDGDPLHPTTVESYKQHLRLHIEPYLGKVKLSQRSAPIIREFLDKLARGDLAEGAEPQPRSKAMVRKIRGSLSALLSDAQERGLVSRNAVRELVRNRKKKGAKQGKHDLEVGVDI